MHLRKRQLGATPVFAFFLNRPFGCQKHHFKLKYESIFSINLQLPGVHRGPTLFPPTRPQQQTGASNIISVQDGPAQLKRAGPCFAYYFSVMVTLCNHIDIDNVTICVTV
jgi:hypothetical protein